MNPNVVFIKPVKSPNLIILFLQDALDALNGRTFDGRDMRISIDEGRPGGPRYESYYIELYSFSLTRVFRYPMVTKTFGQGVKG